MIKQTCFTEQFSALVCNLIMETEEMWVSFCLLSPAHRYSEMNLATDAWPRCRGALWGERRKVVIILIESV